MSNLEPLAQNASSVIPAAELHGLVCGFAAGNPPEFVLSEFVHLAGTDALSDENAVSEFVSESLDELYSQDINFSPLVADDEEPLSQRLADIAQFCAGFLGGFGAAYTQMDVTNRPTRDALPPEVQEILQDFASISGLDDESLDQDEDTDEEQDEVSFMEIFEYVRVAVVLTLSAMTDFGVQLENDE